MSWRWWLLQLAIPIVVAAFLVVMELGHLLGYLPYETSVRH